jgi:hypothetical protein
MKGFENHDLYLKEYIAEGKCQLHSRHVRLVGFSDLRRWVAASVLKSSDVKITTATTEFESVWP